MAANNPGGSNGNPAAWVAITIALITAIGGVLAAVFGPQIVVNVNQQGQATAVAELQPTIISLQNEPTSTSQVVEVTREVEVTRVVEVTREVTVTQIITSPPIINLTGNKRGYGRMVEEGEERRV